jgi:hypothetical protein
MRLGLTVEDVGRLIGVCHGWVRSVRDVESLHHHGPYVAALLAAHKELMA